MNRAADERNELRDVGQVVRISLPPWQEVLPPEEDSPMPGGNGRWYLNGYLRAYTKPGRPDVELSFNCRRWGVGEDEVNRLRELLSLPAQPLGARELDDFSGMTCSRSYRDPHRLVSARTQDWNGRMVLFVQSKWTDPETDLVEIFAPDATYDRIDRIAFEAPHDQFELCAPEIEAALRSIEWKA